MEPKKARETAERIVAEWRGIPVEQFRMERLEREMELPPPRAWVVRVRYLDHDDLYGPFTDEADAVAARAKLEAFFTPPTDEEIAADLVEVTGKSFAETLAELTQDGFDRRLVAEVLPVWPP